MQSPPKLAREILMKVRGLRETLEVTISMMGQQTKQLPIRVHKQNRSIHRNKLEQGRKPVQAVP
jgi:hypothetical protein